MEPFRLNNIWSVWKIFERTIKFARLYFKLLKYSILVVSIIVTYVLQFFSSIESKNGYHSPVNISLILNHYKLLPIATGLLVIFFVTRIFNSTSLQNTILVYVILLRGLEIFPLYHLYQFVYTCLRNGDYVPIDGILLHFILISIKLSNQVTIHLTNKQIDSYKIQRIKSYINYFIHLLLLLRYEDIQSIKLTLLNRLFLNILYNDLYELLSNELIWKKLICFTEMNEHNKGPVHLIKKNELLTFFPSINIAYLITVLRLIIAYAICYDLRYLIEIFREKMTVYYNSLLIMSLLLLLFVTIDCLLMLYHLNKNGVFWFCIGVNQWNNIIELSLDSSQLLDARSLIVTVSHFFNQIRLVQKFKNFFCQKKHSAAMDREIPVIHPPSGTDDTDEDIEDNDTDRIILDLFETDNKTPKIGIIDSNENIQAEDVLVGFVGLSGRGKSQLLRSLTGKDIFKSGSRPTTYKALGTLQVHNNHRYWIIDTPGDLQATKPEMKYYYKRWIDPTYYTSLGSRLKEENGHRYKEATLTTEIVAKYNNGLKQKLHLCVFVFDGRVDDPVKEYYENCIVKHLGTQSRTIFARTRWDSMYMIIDEEVKKEENKQSQLLIETFRLDKKEARIVFTTGLIDEDAENDPEIVQMIRKKGFNNESLQNMIRKTVNDHWDNLQIERQAYKEGLPLRLTELKEGDHILYFPTNATYPYSALVASNQNNKITVYARTARFINKKRQKDSDGTEYRLFSFEEFQRSTFQKVDCEIPADYAKDPPHIIIRQLYKNATKKEIERSEAIEKQCPELKTNKLNIESQVASKAVKRAELIKETTSFDTKPFKIYSSADFVYYCKTGQQPPLDDELWTKYNLSSLSKIVGYCGRAFSYISHAELTGIAQSSCRFLGVLPVVDVAICAVNCYNEPHNKVRHITTASVGYIASIGFGAGVTFLIGSTAPIIAVGCAAAAGGAIANICVGYFIKPNDRENERAINTIEVPTETE